MKEATGELTGSVIVVSAVALLMAFFFMVIWPMIRSNMIDKSNCANAICDIGYNEDSHMVTCYMPDDADKSVTFDCPYKG